MYEKKTAKNNDDVGDPKILVNIQQKVVECNYNSECSKRGPDNIKRMEKR